MAAQRSVSGLGYSGVGLILSLPPHFPLDKFLFSNTLITVSFSTFWLAYTGFKRLVRDECKMFFYEGNHTGSK